MYFCPFCVESCVTIKSLKAHCKLKHYTKLYSSFKCCQKPCPRTFGDSYTFFKHLSKSHAEKNSNIIDTSDRNTEIKKNIQINKSTDINKNIEETMYYSSSESIETPSTSYAINSCDNTVEVITVEEFAKSVAKSSALLVASLYSRPSLPRIFCQEIIKSITTFLDCVKILEDKCKSIELNTHTDLNSMFYILYNSFTDFSSEYKTIQYFKKLNCLIEPQEISIGAVIDSKRKKAITQTVITNKEICILPLEKILQKFLELPEVYDKITSNIKRIKQNKIKTNLLQSEVWNCIEQQFENDVFPLILYFDELEINNPLGSHRGVHKLGAVYCTIGGIDEKYASSLENIFLIQLHNVVDYKFGNKQIFTTLINQIKKLQTDGIIINIGNLKRKINFVLSHILGDNAGLHDIFGLTTSFNSNYSCRICLIDTRTRQTRRCKFTSKRDKLCARCQR